MVVKTQLTGSEVTGLRVGARNVRRYFPRGVRVIELQLDHVQIQCGLSPEFWDGRPEIHDPRLCEWLDFKIIHRLEERKEVTLAMTPSVKTGSDCVLPIWRETGWPASSRPRWPERGALGREASLKRHDLC